MILMQRYSNIPERNPCLQGHLIDDKDETLESRERNKGYYS